MDSALLDDPWIAAQVDAALAPYAGRLPASELAWMRAQLADVLARDERAARLLRLAHPREGDVSGERTSPGAAREGEGEGEEEGRESPGRAKAG